MLTASALISAADLAPGAAYLVCFIVAVVAALRAIHVEKAAVDGLAGKGAVPSDLTVLQPILGGEAGLEQNLRSGVESAPPGTAFVWLVDEDDPVGAAAAEGARSSLPEDRRTGVRIRPCAPAPAAVNPKSAKLGAALVEVETPYVAIVDDDTIVGADHLRFGLRVLSARGSTAALYTGLPSYVSGGGAGSHLVAGFVNAMAARTYLPPLCAGPPASINGMFWMTGTEELRGLGGFGAIETQLCDDLAIAGLYAGAGRRIHQGSMRQLLHTKGLGLGAYVARMHRWFVFATVAMGRSGWGTRAATVGLSLLPSALLWWALARALSSRSALVAIAVVLVLRHLGLGLLLHRTGDRSLPSEAEVFPISSLVAELGIPLHAFHAILCPRIRWRTRRYRVRRGGTFEDAGA